MKRIFFFATPSDIMPVLRKFESGRPLKFVELGNLITPNRAIYLNSCEIPDSGIATHETGHASAAYMVSDRETKNHMNKFVGEEGEYRWTLDNSDNEETVILTMGGLWDDNTLLDGLMDTLHQTPVAQSLMKLFASSLKQEGFTKIKLWWVGKRSFRDASFR